MKYKVGDIVKIRDDLILGGRYNGRMLIDAYTFEYLCGKKVIITNVNKSGVYEIDNRYWATDEMVEDRR